MRNKTILTEKIKESLASVLPVSLVILALSLTATPLSNAVFISFLFGAMLMVVGMGFFTLGVDQSMTPMGEYVGTNMTRSRKLWVVCLISFIVGTLITVSEPDLQVLAGYIPSIDTYTFILTVAVGVGVFLVLAVLRIVFAIKLRYLLFAFYAIVFALAAFVDSGFWSVAFDAGGVTTGPLTVPFIMAMGVGIAAISANKGESGDSFGLMSLCSVGPIIAVLLLGLVYKPDAAPYTPDPLVEFTNSRAFGYEFLSSFPHQMWEVAKSLLPVAVFFFLYQAITRRMARDGLLKILVGTGYTYFGIVIFLVGVNTGFLPVGRYIGESLAGTSYSWVLIPLGMLLGYFIVSAEPAIHVLEKQVEEITSGAIPKKMLSTAMAIGVSCAVGMAMLRVLTGISIMWFVGIGYALALGLSFFVPDIFTSIAFDSGGVASGAMSSAFLVPLAVGASYVLGGNIMIDAFGVIAMVAMLPPITIQILGLIYRFKTKRAEKVAASLGETIIELETPLEENASAEAAEVPTTTLADILAESDVASVSDEYPDIIEFELP